MTLFLPTTPNPTSGFFIMVPRKDAIPSNLSIEEALKMIISAGAVVPPGMKVPPGMMALGVPAKVVRPLAEADRQWILELGLRYTENTVPGYR